MLNNDRKIGLIEETAHNPPYGPGSIRMLAVVKRRNSLDILERVMRRFYLRGLIEETMGPQTDWKAADSAFVQAAAIARDVARYRHAQLSAVKLAGDINATVTDGLSLDELLVKIKEELCKLGPLIDLEAIREQQVVENRLPATANGSEAG